MRLTTNRNPGNHGDLGNTAAGYESPTLVLIGNVHEHVLGMPGSGFDGPYGMSEPDFEFADDTTFCTNNSTL
jgi:hypothetical protein